MEKQGGHEIFNDELPKAAAFLLSHPRNLYRPRVYGVATTSVLFDTAEKNPKWSQQHTWNPERPIQRSTFHWIRMYPLPKDTPADKSPERVWAENLGENRFKITSQFVRKLRIYLHPKMIDFSKPVEVVANGRTVFHDKVAPSLRTMLELVREFDDRGRIFYAAIDVDIPTDADVPEPRRGRGADGGAVRAARQLVLLAGRQSSQSFAFSRCGRVLLGDVADVLADQRFDLQLEAVVQQPLDLLLPLRLVGEPGVAGDLLGPLAVGVVQRDLHAVRELALLRNPSTAGRETSPREWPSAATRRPG